MARPQPLARQHPHPPARPRHVDADRHRQSGLGAHLHLEPERGHPRLRRGAGERARLLVKHFIGGHNGRLGTRADVTLHQQYMADIADSSRKAIDTVDPTAYFQKYGENMWAAVKGYLDEVTRVAAAPVIEKYTGVIAAADIGRA